MSLDDIAAQVLAAVPVRTRALVAVDGVGASGKTTFATALAGLVTTRPVVVLHVDDFFNVAAVRHARGRTSAEGSWLDAINTPALRSTLDHLAAQGDGLYRAASIDHRTGKPCDLPPQAAAPRALVLVEGIFLHRDELADYWDFSIWLDVAPGEAARRMVLRDGLHSDDPRLLRYEGAQQLYLEAARPRERATMVIDMTEPSAPRVVA
ncbi:uridine kinase [Cellulomonas sp.]|uniref:uridine kinase n=1 Tax=Cellulomonas sp. TaxID=40001 RepID=UPI002811155C|nr:uridine kinase [Cellulomonas sp.]